MRQIGGVDARTAILHPDLDRGFSEIGQAGAHAYPFPVASMLDGIGHEVADAVHQRCLVSHHRRQRLLDVFLQVHAGIDQIGSGGGERAVDGGLYFDGLKESRAEAQAYDRRAQQKLRELSLALSGLP